MDTNTYLKELLKALHEGKISEDAFDMGILNISIFCDDIEEED